METIHYNQGQSSRAVITTGYDASTNYGGKYDYITITTLGNSAYFGDMQTAARDKQGCGSAIRASLVEEQVQVDILMKLIT